MPDSEIVKDPVTGEMGKWTTMLGRPVFVRENESSEEAMKRLGLGRGDKPIRHETKAEGSYNVENQERSINVPVEFTEVFVRKPSDYKQKQSTIRVGEDVRFEDNQGMVIKSTRGYFLVKTSKGLVNIPVKKAERSSEFLNIGIHWDHISDAGRLYLLEKINIPKIYYTRNWLEIPRKVQTLLKNIPPEQRSSTNDETSQSGTHGDVKQIRKDEVENIAFDNINFTPEGTNSSHAGDEPSAKKQENANKHDDSSTRSTTYPPDDPHPNNGWNPGKEQGMGMGGHKLKSHSPEEKISDNVETPEDYKPKSEPAPVPMKEADEIEDEKLKRVGKDGLSTGTSGAMNAVNQDKNNKHNGANQHQDTDKIDVGYFPAAKSDDFGGSRLSGYGMKYLTKKQSEDLYKKLRKA